MARVNMRASQIDLFYLLLGVGILFFTVREVLTRSPAGGPGGDEILFGKRRAQ